MRKSLVGLALAVALVGSSFSVEAASFGRPSSPSISVARSAPAPSFSAPAAPRPSVAPGGIGGTTSMGVRKSEVTAPVAAQVQAARAPATSSASPSYGSTGTNYVQGTQGTTYVQAPVQSAPSPAVGAFGGALAGSVVGSVVGNAISNHPSYNNNGYMQPAPVMQSPVYTQPVDGGGYAQPVAQSSGGSGIGHFIWNMILFAIALAVAVGIAYLIYNGYKKSMAYVNNERGIAPDQPFNPTQQFWKIQHLFAEADAAGLKALLGPDLVDEATRNLVPNDITLSGVSHEVVLNNAREFSVHYKFSDAGEVIDQVWHYEKFGDKWLLNGMETV